MQPTDAVLDFEQDVIAASHERPVLVDFWAPWCGPCRVLGPTLDKLDAESDAWSLVKVNTDQHQALSARFQIRGIPAVKLFASGEVVAEFTGALPEPALRRWLADHLPSRQKALLADATARLDAGNRAAALPLLEDAYAENEANPDARVHLARAVVFDDPDRARTLVDGQHTQTAVGVRSLAGFLQRDPATLAEAPVRPLYAEALTELQQGDADAALTRFIQVLVQDRSYDADGARRACLAVFATLGEGHPVVKQHRPVFNRSLY
ncbi:MAG: tetratricopeptide repeat protein [Bacteroidota bacterium]